MSYNLKITVYNNRDYEQPFILRNDDETPYDLTECSLAFGYGTDVKTLATHITGNSANKCLEITNAANGEFKLILPFAVLKTLGADNYLHDLILITPDNKRTGIWSGQMVIKRGLA